MQLVVEPSVTLLPVNAAEPAPPGVHQAGSLKHNVVHTPPLLSRQAKVKLQGIARLTALAVERDTRLGPVTVDLRRQNFESMSPWVSNALHIAMLKEAQQRALPGASPNVIELLPQAPKHLLGEVIDVEMAAGDLCGLSGANRRARWTGQGCDLRAAESLKHSGKRRLNRRDVGDTRQRCLDLSVLVRRCAGDRLGDLSCRLGPGGCDLNQDTQRGAQDPGSLRAELRHTPIEYRL